MKILITGASGQIGKHLIPLLAKSNHSFSAPTHQQLDITDCLSTELAVSHYKPDVVINLAAYTAVDLAETNVDLAFSVNRLGAENISRAAAIVDAAIIHLSTDYVFAGNKTFPYTETDVPNPINIYGKSKLAGEQEVAKHNHRHLIVRTAWVFSGESKNFYTTMRKLATMQSSISVVNDQCGSPTFANDIAQAILTLVNYLEEITSSDWGIYHYAGAPCATWFDVANEIFASNQFSTATPALNPVSSSQYASSAKRPANSCLLTRKITERWAIPPSNWRNGLKILSSTYFHHR